VGHPVRLGWARYGPTGPTRSRSTHAANPNRHAHSTTPSLARGQATALLAAADADTGPQALRTAAIVATLTIKGDRDHLVALPAPVTRRLDACLANRLTSPATATGAWAVGSGPLRRFVRGRLSQLVDL
jgi:integrase/recombinase XerD